MDTRDASISAGDQTWFRFRFATRAAHAEEASAASLREHRRGSSLHDESTPQSQFRRLAAERGRQ